MSTWWMRLIVIVAAVGMMAVTLLVWAGFGSEVMQAMMAAPAVLPQQPQPPEEKGVFTVRVLPAPHDCAKDRDHAKDQPCPK